MVKIISNAEVAGYDRASHNRWGYNALDCAVMHEVHSELADVMVERTRAGKVYRAQLGLQAPTMLCELRGIRFDHEEAKRVIGVLDRAAKRCRRIIDAWAESVPEWRSHPARKHEGLNPNSPEQVKGFFYGALGIPEIRNKYGKVSTDLKTLEKIRDKKAANARSPEAARQVAKAILHARDYIKQQDVPKAHVKLDRARFKLSVGQTKTFRMSSSADNLGQGSNVQNVTGRRRGLFLADPGYKLAYIDLAQAESNVLAHLSGDENYIEAHVNPDVDTHTMVAKMCWPEADWPGDGAGPLDTKKAKEPGFYRHFSMRDLSKKVQHAVGRGGTKVTVARDLNIPQRDAQDIIDRFFAGFPEVKNYMDWLHEELKERGKLVVPGIDVPRLFFDRVWETSVWRDALSFVCQAPVAWCTHLGFWRVYKYLDGKSLEPVDPLQLLLHAHDAIMIQYHEGREDLRRQAMELMLTPLRIRDYKGTVRTVTIGVEAEVGYDWKNVEELEESFP
jgi:hypothetical protein